MCVCRCVWLCVCGCNCVGVCGCDWMGEIGCMGVAASIDSMRVYVVVCSVCGCLVMGAIVWVC